MAHQAPLPSDASTPAARVAEERTALRSLGRTRLVAFAFCLLALLTPLICQVLGWKLVGEEHSLHYFIACFFFLWGWSAHTRRQRLLRATRRQ